MESDERLNNCREILALLSHYFDSKLPPEACPEVEAHLSECPACIEFAQSLRRTVELCRQHRPTELPEPIGRQARQQLMEACLKALDRTHNDGKTGAGHPVVDSE